MLKKKRFLIGGVVIFAAIGYLIYMGIAASATANYTVSGLLEQGSSLYSKNVRVEGQVAPGSIKQTDGGLALSFTMTDTKTATSLPVVYRGVAPDTFKAGGEVVVEGQLNSDGVLQARTLMAKCPTRYVPEG